MKAIFEINTSRPKRRDCDPRSLDIIRFCGSARINRFSQSLKNGMMGRKNGKSIDSSLRGEYEDWLAIRSWSAFPRR